jgi:hypothetical protein
VSRVLIASGRGDWSAEQVAKQLDARGCAYSWLDPADFPQRVRVMAKHDFAVAIHAHSAAARIDWRTDYDALTYEVIDCPARITDRVHNFLSAAGLPMGRSTSLSPLTPRTTYFWSVPRLGSGGGLPRRADSPSPKRSPTS